jgi:hypothetical protein
MDEPSIFGIPVHTSAAVDPGTLHLLSPRSPEQVAIEEEFQRARGEMRDQMMRTFRVPPWMPSYMPPMFRL